MSQNKLWESIERIEGLSVQAGLDRVSGQREDYQTLLQMVTREIEKCDKNLQKFLAAGDMHNFRIEVHGIKGSLANIGAMELSAKALELEKASAQEDTAFCAANLPGFLEALQGFKLRITEAFAQENQNHGPIALPPEFPPVFEKLTAAFDKMDFLAVDEGIESLDTLNPEGPLKEETEKIKDAVLTMDFDGAKKVIRELLGG